MCGIVGWAYLNSQTEQNSISDEMLLRSLCGKLRHRGPDSEGVLAVDGVALGMRRLAIIDLNTGEQPVFNEDRSIAVVMNGEIYNFRALRSGLEKRGHRFQTQTDTEVLPHLYEEHPKNFIEKLNGMFAFALWDFERKQLVLARDRFGEKPLYYGVFGGKLIFASELKALAAHPAVETKLNLRALRQYLAFDYVPAPLSIYENIYKLPAAHRLTLENGAIKIERYWNLSFKKPIVQPSVESAAKGLRGILAKAVESQMAAADVPVGVLLSGGVDSSTVAALAQTYSSRPIKTFSIGFDEASFDESDYARRVAAHLGTDHHEDRLSVEKAIEILPEIAGWLDEPLADASVLPTFLLARFVRQHVAVALGGDGGDEIFAGYPMYYAHKLADKYIKLPSFIRSNFIAPIVERLPVSTKNLSFDYKAKRFIESFNYGFGDDKVVRHFSWFASFPLWATASVLSEDTLKQTDPNEIFDEAKRWQEICDAANLTEQMQFLDMKFYLAEDILTKVDRASMAVSLEVRAPFLDPRIAEFAASLPTNYKLNGRQTKFILKKAVAPLLPDFVVKRPKKGFGIPVAEWLKTKLNPLARDLLAPDRLKKQNLFNADFVQKLLAEHEQNRANHYKLLWTLLVFQLWTDNFPH